MNDHHTLVHNPADAVLQHLAREEPGLNRWAVRGALRRFFTWRGSEDPGLPTAAELSTFLAERSVELGSAGACTEFAYLQIGAARLWGAEMTSHFAVALRTARVGPKTARQSEWVQAAKAVDRLPARWRSATTQHLERSRTGGRAARGISRWSASRVKAVIDALARWRDHCAAQGHDEIPCGTTLDAYAQALTANGDKPVSASTAANYLERIYAGFTAVILPGFASEACEFVIRDWRERGERDGTPTKTPAQLVSATAIFDLGFEIIEHARSRCTRGVRAALDFRNGVLLATAIALPQRARALSALEFGRTLKLRDAGTVHVPIPGRWLKEREDRKERAAFDRVLENGRLAAALSEYARDYRPLFDDGTLLFPSYHAPMQSVSEKQLGRLAGDLTLAHFGVRIPIHRFRDNVATEAAEELPGGGRLAAAILGHRDLATTTRHYDHSEGYVAARAYGEALDARRRAPEELSI